MKHIKTYEPSVDGGPDTGCWPTMEECGVEGSWVTFTEYEILQDENIDLKRENERLKECLPSDIEGPLVKFLQSAAQGAVGDIDKLRAENKRLMALVNSHTDDS